MNSIFGNNGLAPPHLEQGEREAMRALFDGLYGVHRNKYAHADAAVEWYEVEATLSMVTWTLMWLQKNEARLRVKPNPSRSTPAYWLFSSTTSRSGTTT